MLNAKNNIFTSKDNKNNNIKTIPKISKKEPRIDIPDLPNKNRIFNRGFKPKIRIGQKITYKQPRPTNLMFRFTKNKNNNNNNNNRRNRFSKILDFLLHPYKMALNNEFYSIFPTSFKIVRMSVYTRIETTVANGDKFLWYPYGVGNRPYMESMASIDFNGHGPLTKYSNLYRYIASADSVAPISVNMIDFPCRYRLIGASFRITNTTNINSKSGNLFITKDSLEGANYPTYFPAYNVIPNNDFKFNLIDIFHNNVNNAAIKNNISAVQTFTINEVNTCKGNDIFCGGSEYLSDAYKRYNLNTTVSDDYLVMQSATNRFANNVVYRIDHSASTSQSIVIEQWQIVDVIPAGTSAIAGLAHDSIRGCNPRMISIIDKSNPIEIFN